MKEDNQQTSEFNLFQECSKNILKNVDNYLTTRSEDHRKTSKLLSIRWYLANELGAKTN